jgi:membrane fusion protein (multidrug efflux system)
MENGSEYVYLAADGLAQKTRVEIGTSDQTISEILSGLSEGDLVVIAGQDLIDDGDPLNVVK